MDRKTDLQIAKEIMKDYRCANGSVAAQLISKAVAFQAVHYENNFDLAKAADGMKHLSEQALYIRDEFLKAKNEQRRTQTMPVEVIPTDEKWLPRLKGCIRLENNIEEYKANTANCGYAVEVKGVKQGRIKLLLTKKFGENTGRFYQLVREVEKPCETKG